MKISKILFISFFALLGIFLIALPIHIKSNIGETAKKRSLYNNEVISLPEFNHLIVAHNSCFEISDGEENTIIYSFPEDSLIDIIEYRISGDTLILPQQKTRKFQSVKIRCGNLESITSQVSLSIEKSQDTLSICSKAGQTIIRGNNFKQLNIIGQGGKLRTASSIYIDELNVHLNKSKLDFYDTKVDRLNATMENNAKMTIKRANSININKDKTCQFKENS